MMREYVFSCVFIITICKPSLISVTPTATKSGGLFVNDGKINGKKNIYLTLKRNKYKLEKANSDMYSDLQDKRILYFTNGDLIEYTCSHNYSSKSTESIEIFWMQQKGKDRIFDGSIEHPITNNVNEAKLIMEAYTFDNDSNIICVSRDKRESKMKDQHAILLRISTGKNNPSEPVDEKILNKDKNFTMECTKSPNDRMLAVLPSNNVSTNHLSTFIVGEEHNGIMLLCLHLKISSLNGITNSKREAYNFIKIALNGGKFFPDASTSANNDSTPTPAKSNKILYASGAVIIAVALISAVCIIKVWKSKVKGVETNQQSIDLHATIQQAESAEPLYAAPEEIVYAELQLAQEMTRSQLNRQEENPYAVVIGILTQAKNDLTKIKPEQKREHEET